MKIILGTAQFGLTYGINNKSGKISREESRKIFDYAFENGLYTLDTATGYGESETVIGDYIKSSKNRFDIITKLGEKGDADTQVKDSFLKLGVEKLYGFLVHNFSFYKEYPETYDLLLSYKKKGVISKTGFSLYYPGELDILIENNIEFDLIQIPYSIFDRRFEPYFPLLKEKRVEIHTRSAFLQGLIFISPENLPVFLSELSPKLKELRRIAEDNEISVLSLALDFVTSNGYIDKVVVGIDSLDHLKEILSALDKMDSMENVHNLFYSFEEEEERLILPFNWKDL